MSVDLIRIPDSIPYSLGGEPPVYLIDQLDWFELTLGRFLAPAAYDGETQGVVYVLRGVRLSEDSTRIPIEVDAFASSLDRLSEHVGDLIGHEPSGEEVLVSLRSLRELNLPDPDREDAFQLRDGLLVMTGWGLTQGVSLERLLSSKDERHQYIEKIRDHLNSMNSGGLEARSDQVHPPRRAGGDSPFPSRTDYPSKKERRISRWLLWGSLTILAAAGGFVVYRYRDALGSFVESARTTFGI